MVRPQVYRARYRDEDVAVKVLQLEHPIDSATLVCDTFATLPEPAILLA
jgi:hypothetical protein